MTKYSDEKNIDKLLNFMEEFSWLLENYKGLKIIDAIELIKKSISKEDKRFLTTTLEDNCDNEKRQLVGIFPELFQNKALFSSNQSIIEFSNDVLRTSINPSKNRSKNEIIGEIVCTTYSLNNSEMKKVVSALEKIVDNETVMNSVTYMKKETSFTWNDIIQKLAD